MFHPDIDFQTTIEYKRRREAAVKVGRHRTRSSFWWRRRERPRRNYVLGGSLLEEIEKENLRQQHAAGGRW